MVHTRLFAPVSRRIAGCFDVRISGFEHIPRDSGAIYVMNHQSVLDVFVAYAMLGRHTNRPVRLFLSHRFYAFFWPLVKLFGVVSVRMDMETADRRRQNGTRIPEGIKILSKGESILIFPEGIITGGRDETVGSGGTGAVRMSIASGVPIIPVGIRGSNSAYPFLLTTRNPLVVRRKFPVTVTVGEPVSYPEYSGMKLNEFTAETRMALRQITNQLMNRLSELSGLQPAEPGRSFP